MDLNAGLKEMARHCYGYGRWDAPYWFIGLGEAMEPGANIQKRVEAWQRRGRKTGLSDCREFHKCIGENRWHRQEPLPPLAPTWRRLILLLKAFHREPVENDHLRLYQRDYWGMTEAETCIIELFGLSAPNFKAYKALMLELFTQEQIDEILRERICFIRKKINEHAPKLVVMYGRGARKQWKEIAGGRSFRDDEIFKIGATVMVYTTHPTAHDVTDAYWESLGEELRVIAGSPNL
jgi:hypothetical protein